MSHVREPGNDHRKRRFVMPAEDVASSAALARSQDGQGIERFSRATLVAKPFSLVSRESDGTARDSTIRRQSFLYDCG